MGYKLRHWWIDTQIDLLAKIRARTKFGSGLDVLIGEIQIKLLNKQMVARKKAGIKEIQCHVIWGIDESN